MATIILDYNTRNTQAQKALDYILSLGVFKIQSIEMRAVMRIHFFFFYLQKSKRLN